MAAAPYSFQRLDSAPYVPFLFADLDGIPALPSSIAKSTRKQSGNFSTVARRTPSIKTGESRRLAAEFGNVLATDLARWANVIKHVGI
jgi:hypothetical protein